MTNNRVAVVWFASAGVAGLFQMVFEADDIFWLTLVGSL